MLCCLLCGDTGSHTNLLIYLPNAFLQHEFESKDLLPLNFSEEILECRLELIKLNDAAMCAVDYFLVHCQFILATQRYLELLAEGEELLQVDALQLLLDLVECARLSLA